MEDQTLPTDGTAAEPAGKLFDLDEPAPAPASPPSPDGRRRLRYAHRTQVSMRTCSLDQLIPEDHPVRTVWAYVEGLDLSELERKIKAVEGRAGASATDPRILLTLWLYATLRGIGSARELDRRCDPDLGEVPFQWISGGVTLNYHTLADFRVQHVDVLDGLLTSSVAVLLEQDLVSMERVAQDGMKVRASAGAASFRRRSRLEQFREEAQAQVEALKKEVDTDPAAGTRRQQAARARARADRAERLRRALEQLPQVEASKPVKERDKARVSTTDPEARVMKMGDGGYRPAYNVQLATDTQTQIITGIDAINSGGDQGKLAPMVEQHDERYQEKPQAMLVDGGFAKKEDIESVEQAGTTVYAPVQASKDPQRDPHTPRPDDTPKVAEWRQRMATAAAKEIYKERASTAECVNAHARNRGLYQFRVRGLAKVKAVVLLYVLAHNLMRARTVRAERENQRE
ncbi:MAG TPA: IS1182 family transposase [Gemmataceae bacterium]|nr:IS1182 family transposase [Gemmataceae bacterium]